MKKKTPNITKKTSSNSKIPQIIQKFSHKWSYRPGRSTRPPIATKIISRVANHKKILRKREFFRVTIPTQSRPPTLKKIPKLEGFFLMFGGSFVYFGSKSRGAIFVLFGRLFVFFGGFLFF
jgi:hypothetical protein